MRNFANRMLINPKNFKQEVCLHLEQVQKKNLS